MYPRKLAAQISLQYSDCNPLLLPCRTAKARLVPAWKLKLFDEPARPMAARPSTRGSNDDAISRTAVHGIFAFAEPTFFACMHVVASCSDGEATTSLGLRL